MIRRLPSLSSPRSIALDLLDAVLVRHVLLDQALQAHRHLPRLSDRDRAFARILVATVLRRLGQIDDLLARCLERSLPAKANRVRDVLRLGCAQLVFMGTPPHAAIATAVDLLKGTNLGGFANLVNAVLRRIDRDGRDWAATQDAARLNTPAWMWQSWTAAYGEAAARAIAEANLKEPCLDITVAGDAAAWAEKLDAELLPTGSLRRHGQGDPAILPGYAQGVWWVQNAAAALPARLLGEVAGLRVADLCAAPGGKTLQLAAAGAKVTALDRSAKRLETVRRNLERTGLAAELVAADACQWRPGEPFDAILLDAPCTATGTLRRHPDGVWLKNPGDVAALADLQTALIRAATEMLRPGGRLVYCVCSLETAEGPDQIEKALAADPRLKRQPILAGEVGGISEILTPDGDLRTLPFHLAGQGGLDAFFAARLTRI